MATVSVADCEWMYGDAATGLLGFNVMAGMNPLRWSGSLSFQACIAQLQESQKHMERPVILKVPSGVMAQEQHFPTHQATIEYLMSLAGSNVVYTQAPTGSVTYVAQPGGSVQMQSAAPSVVLQPAIANSAGSQVFAAPSMAYANPVTTQAYTAPAITTMSGGSASMIMPASTSAAYGQSVIMGGSAAVPAAQIAYPQVQYTQGPSNLTYMGAPLASGGSVALPAVQYGLANASGSVEVPVYGGSVDVQRMYQNYARVEQRTMSPVPVATMSAMSPEQLKFVFPHGAPANYAVAPAAYETVAAAGTTVVETPAPATTEAPAVEAVSSSKKSSSKKKSSKKKLSSKKKSKGGCC